MPTLKSLLLLCTLAPVALAGAANAGSGGPGVSRDAGDWVIEATVADRASLVKQLAILSKSRLSIDPALPSRLPALRLRWRGPSLAEAWRQLLGDEVSHALRCSPQACEVWIVGTAATAHGRGEGTPRTANAPAAAAGLSAPPPQPDAPGLFPAD